MRLAEPAAALIVLCTAATPAAAQMVQVNIPAGRLSDALIALAEQTGLTIGASDPALSGVRTRPLRGRMSARAALDRLLAGTGYRYAFVNARGVRIMRGPPPPRRRPSPPAPAVSPPPSPPPALIVPPIIVTASKQDIALDRFGGTVRLIDLDHEAGRFGARGSDAILSRLPMLASTSLGPGRNKIYVRGIADSSFNGPSQSIVGQYLGDVRLTFSAPNPDLHLHDIRRVELLEGPQGTLYGTGSLGGILRFVPHEPDSSVFSAGLTAGLLATRHGGWGSDVSIMFNAPLVRDRLAVRAVAYASSDAGYIDDVGRGLRDVNRTSVVGGRAVLRWEPGDRWRIDIGALSQNIDGRDGQYAMRGLPPLSRRTNLAQPFANDYQLAHLTVRKRWDGVELVSTTSLARHDLETRFDASGFPGTEGPQLYAEDVNITLISNETRIAQSGSRGEGWVFGWSVLSDTNHITRRLGPPSAALPLPGVRNETHEVALFGQYSLSLTSRLVATLGGRLTVAESIGEPLDSPDDDEDEPNQTNVHVSPAAALTWTAGDGWLAYLRYQEGYRAGGLAVSPTASASPTQRLDSDELTSIEAGLRFGRRDVGRLSFTAAASYTAWTDIQADLIDMRGLPYTANLGDGRIYGLEIEGSWRLTSSLSVDMAGFFNDSALSNPNPPFADQDGRDLPNIASSGARMAAHFRTDLAPSLSLAVDGSIRYVGESQLGAGGPADVSQGDFVEGQIGARLDFGRFGLSLDVDNVGDVRGNRFSFGNPFSLADGTQITPLRPRTIRIGFDAEF
ncbi:TonB-dependent receptor domain-containing protein [Sphingosinicella terrae]|uniref:TonB-dependent receptor domain-containing protein n=1 Tax=Sphingosinicella terrae TaxID=2172047 RepID=UPI000E0D6C50|nr:TonB-dependent receptor [Sphingosinicella terrae]